MSLHVSMTTTQHLYDSITSIIKINELGIDASIYYVLRLIKMKQIFSVNAITRKRACFSKRVCV